MIIELPQPKTSPKAIASVTEPPALVIDQSLQSRAAMNPDIVDSYAERMEAGDQFPPIIVFSVGNDLLLVDGFHRYHAAKKAGLVALAVTVRRGTRQDAIAYAITANSSHGLARSNADKRRSVVMALQEFADISDRSIAEMCKVSQPFVSSVRRGLKTVISSGKRVGRDGKRRLMPGRRIRQVSTDVQATQPGSMQESDATAAQGGQGNAEFHADEAWDRIEEFLCAELVKWPEHMRQHLQVQLREFTDRNC